MDPASLFPPPRTGRDDGGWWTAHDERLGSARGSVARGSGARGERGGGPAEPRGGDPRRGGEARAGAGAAPSRSDDPGDASRRASSERAGGVSAPSASTDSRGRFLDATGSGAGARGGGAWPPPPLKKKLEMERCAIADASERLRGRVRISRDDLNTARCYAPRFFRDCPTRRIESLDADWLAVALARRKSPPTQLFFSCRQVDPPSPRHCRTHTRFQRSETHPTPCSPSLPRPPSAPPRR